ncbi:Type II inositol 1,4,5-trisphosphate 5-phosphatase [Microbotryomycetes sp. JL201]|nr:Type II inositol 1,4,5-trisphosphate 5-phosphatase [Microbotryomycetes sp. JL201]
MQQAAPATYGLASQLRTPPMDDGTGAFYSTSSQGAPYGAKNVTPAMRDELRTSPRLSSTPAWASRAPAPDTQKSIKQLRQENGKSLPATRRDSKASHRYGFDGAGGGGGGDHQAQSYTSLGKPQLHARTLSSDTYGAPPPRPARPGSPDDGSFKRGAQAHGPLSRHGHSASVPNARYDYDNAPARLDLGIQLDNAQGATTYHAAAGGHSHQAHSHLARAPMSPTTETDEEGMYEANVSVGVAQRLQRANSYRKASVNVLQQNRDSSGSQHLSPLDHAAAENHLREQRRTSSSSRGSTGERGIGQGQRQSYSGPGSAPATTTPAHRGSSVYIPNSGAIPVNQTYTQQPPAPQSLQSLPAPVPAAEALARLDLKMLSLAKRTAHLSDLPGYGWRLNLLEKLEEIMGSYLSMQEAEAILSIGDGPDKKSNRRADRKSLIGMPTASPKKPAATKAKSGDKGGFFSKMKRKLGQPQADDKTHQSAQPTTKAIFGVPLATVAEYGFVTSMIAGQRHDLPGVCFSAVEEIYRRGQGMNVPGLMHLAGEASRVAKLVAIYDSPPDYGEHHDLSIESIHNVTSLLKKYLRDLPEPILDQRLWRLYLLACVDSAHPSKNRVACAQILLRLLPTPNFSLLVYLTAFLSQMPLFPENRLTLESVSAIFGPAVMSPRPGPSTANKLQKFVSNGMHISGPTDTYEMSGSNAKKAQDGLLWLLNNWSSVADGLLEPDFDVDVDAVLDRTPRAEELEEYEPYDDQRYDDAEVEGLGAREMPVNFDGPARPRADSANFDAASAHTLEISAMSPTAEDVQEPVLLTEAPRKAPTPIAVSAPMTAGSTATPSPIGTTQSSNGSPILPKSFGHLPSTTSPAPQNDDEGPSPRTPQPPVFATMTNSGQEEDLAPMTPPKDGNDWQSRKGSTSTSNKGSNGGKVDSNPGTTRSSHSSGDDSSLHSAYEPTPKIEQEETDGAKDQVPDDRKHAAEATTVRVSDPRLSRAQPEDEYGPIAPGSSVLEDLLEFDNSSIYSFPAPPDAKSAKRPSSHHVNLAAFEPRRQQRGSVATDNSVTLVRSSGEQLREAQQLIESQRHDIQTLWKQLTDLEAERTADRQEMMSLRDELRLLRQELTTSAALARQQQERQILEANDGNDEDDKKWEAAKAKMQQQHEVVIASMDTKYQSALKETASLKDELKRVQQERQREHDDAEHRVAELESQLNGIRSLLSMSIKMQ